MGDHIKPLNHVQMTIDIASAFVSHNALPHSDLASLIQTIHSSLEKIVVGSPPAMIEAPQEPAVPVRKSVTPDFIICLEDGKRFKSLKRHLRVAFGLSPDDYRAKWNLPRDYPMVAPAYGAARSAFAKQFGLGQQRPEAMLKPTPQKEKGVQAGKRGPGRPRTSAAP